MKNLKILSVFLLVILSSAMIAQEQRAPAAFVEVSSVEKIQLKSSISIPANVISRQHAWLHAETSGKVLGLKPIGSKVKKGAILANIDTKILDSQYAEQVSSVASEASQISYLRNQVKRLQELQTQNIAAKSQIEETQANLDRAINNKAAAEARLQQIEIALAASKVRAPYSGIVSEHAMQKGEWVSPGREILRIVNVDSLEILARTTLSNIPFLKINDTLLLNTNNKSGAAKVRALVPYGDVTEGIYELRLSITEGNWRVGEKISAQIPQSEDNLVLAVPRDAIILRADGSSIIKVNTDNSTQRMQVTTGLGNGQYVGINSVSGELNVGDQVVIRGGERLRDGQTVSIKK